MNGAKLCDRCGHSYNNHSDGFHGPCRTCLTCDHFVESLDSRYRVRFRHMLKWTRNWLKLDHRHSMKRLKELYKSLRYEIGYFGYCPCKKAIILVDNSSTEVARVSDGLVCARCGRCRSCCSCKVCTECHKTRRRDEYCKSCKLCIASNNCCKCIQCSLCDKKCGGDQCYNCGHCNACCISKKCECLCFIGTRVPRVSQKPVFHTPAINQHKVNPMKRFLSAEIEVASIGARGVGSTLYDLVKKWGGSIVRDGSLPESGFEVNTSPAGGDVFINQVQEICDKINALKPLVDYTCGLHIHIDARDFSYYDIRRLVKVYAAIEMGLFDMVPEERQHSKYCRPCGVKYASAIAAGRLPYSKVKSDVISSVYKKKSSQVVKYSKYNNARYSALNLHSWFYRGTIESRIFDGTTNPTIISNFGILWSFIMEYALHTADEEVIRDMVGNPLQCLRKVVKDDKKMLDFIMNRVVDFGALESKNEVRGLTWPL